MFGDIPVWEKDDARCLAGHVMAVQECSVPISEAKSANLDAEQAAASAVWSAAYSHPAVGVRGALRTRYRRYAGVSRPIQFQQVVCGVPDRGSR